jgi:hypothetical protein
MVEAAARTAWATDKGMTIAMGVVTALREARILLPSISTIERASRDGTCRARKPGCAIALIEGLSGKQVQALDQLFDAAGHEPSRLARPSRRGQARSRPPDPRPSEAGAEDRHFPDVAGRIHADRFRQYVREGRASPAYMIERYIPSRRRATLVAFLLDLEERLTDSALEMADKLIGGIFTRAKNAQARSYAATSKNVAPDADPPQDDRRSRPWRRYSRRRSRRPPSSVGPKLRGPPPGVIGEQAFALARLRSDRLRRRLPIMCRKRCCAPGGDGDPHTRRDITLSGPRKSSMRSAKRCALRRRRRREGTE